MNSAARSFCKIMLTYVVDNNWGNIDRTNPVLPEKYAVLIGLSFSAVIQTEYADQPIPGEICRVPISPDATREGLVEAFLREMEK